MNNVLEPPQRKETHQHRKKRWWLRPGALRLAFLVMRIVGQIAKLIDFLNQ